MAEIGVVHHWLKMLKVNKIEAILLMPKKVKMNGESAYPYFEMKYWHWWIL